MRAGFPLAFSGQKIGLLGGSFDPPHRGHVEITSEALQRFGLDQVWWLVTPGNPLKAHGPAPVAERIAKAHAIIAHPRVRITALECHLGTRYTAQTLRKLTALYHGVHFTWIMGADNMVSLHRWDDWETIMQTVPVGVLARPGSTLRAGLSRAARIYPEARLPEAQSHRLGGMSAPAWCLVHMPLNKMSSSAIRAGRVTP